MKVLQFFLVVFCGSILFMLQILLKWGEYSNDVQFILQRNDSNKSSNVPNNRIKPLNVHNALHPHHTVTEKDTENISVENK